MLESIGGIQFEDMVKEYDPTAAAPDWELVSKSPEDGVIDTPPLDAEAIIAERNESIGTGVPSEKVAAEITALTAELKGETAPMSGNEKGAENELTGYLMLPQRSHLNALHHK